MAAEEWTSTEIENGRFKTTNGEVTIMVFADFSGYVENERTGDLIQFDDLRTLIKGASVLEKALTDHYGGWQ